MILKLEITGPEHARNVYEYCPGQRIVFGRGRGAGILAAKEDRAVSHRHFDIEVTSQKAFISDVGSLNGTFVNGEKTGSRELGLPSDGAAPGAARELSDGDIIQAGGYEFLVTFCEPSFCMSCGLPIEPEQARGEALVGGGYLCPSCLGARARQRSADMRPDTEAS